MASVRYSTLIRQLERELGRLAPAYADYRLIRFSRLIDRTKNARISESKEVDSWAIGVRLLYHGAFGFASTHVLTGSGIRDVLARAHENAELASRLRRSDIELAPCKPRHGKWQTPIRENPWKLKSADRLEPLLEAEAWLRNRRQNIETRGELDFSRREIFFCSTEGARTRQILYRTGGWLRAESYEGSEKIIRTWPGPSGCYRGEGFEAIERLSFKKEAVRIADELLELRRSPSSPVGIHDLILKNSILAVQLHETFGHGSESDRLYGYEDNFGGRTYLDTGLVGSVEIAASIVSVISDSRPVQRGGAGTFAFDDEGVPAARREIVRKGVLRGFLTSRETAAFLNEPGSSASMVTQDGTYQPLIRMTNLNLEPGKGTEAELIRGVEDGFLLDNELSWSIDEIRLGFQIGAECGYRIKNGRIAGMVREPFYHGNSLDFWKSCDGIAGRGSWALWGFADCRKGAPYQDVFCSHGIAPARFRKVNVGRNV